MKLIRLENEKEPPSSKDSMDIGPGMVPALGLVARRATGLWQLLGGLPYLPPPGGSLHSRCLVVLGSVQRQGTGSIGTTQPVS